MTSTGFGPEEQAVPGRSVGYTRFGGGEWHPNTHALPYRGTSAGGGYSTVEDLVRFANALLGYKLLNAQYTSLLTTGRADSRRDRREHRCRYYAGHVCADRAPSAQTGHSSARARRLQEPYRSSNSAIRSSSIAAVASSGTTAATTADRPEFRRPGPDEGVLRTPSIVFKTGAREPQRTINARVGTVRSRVRIPGPRPLSCLRT